MTEIPPKFKKWPKYPWNLKITKMSFKPKKLLKQCQNLNNDQNSPKNLKIDQSTPLNLKNDRNTFKT